MVYIRVKQRWREMKHASQGGVSVGRRVVVDVPAVGDNYANGISDEIDAYNEFYSNIKSNMENVEETVGTIIDALLAKQKVEAAGGACGAEKTAKAEAPAAR